MCALNVGFSMCNAVRTTDQETIVTEKTICHSQFLRGEAAQHGDHTGSTGQVRRQSGPGGHRQEPYLWLPWECETETRRDKVADRPQGLTHHLNLLDLFLQKVPFPAL